MSYAYPSQHYRAELTIERSRFICSVGFADSTVVAKQFIQHNRDEMADANHHVYAFRVGHGNSVIEGMSDDGEPSGTAGPPTLAVVRGSMLGDIVVVTTRYFGGTKLGTGGLVRAYTEVAQLAIAGVPTLLKVPYSTLLVELGYELFGRSKSILETYAAQILDTSFTDSTALLIRLETRHVVAFEDALRDLSAGKAHISHMD